MTRASNDITISGGGSVAISTADIFSAAHRLQRLSAELASARALLRHADSELGATAARTAGPAAARAERAMREAGMHAHEAETLAEVTSGGLRAGADAYGALEHALAATAQRVAAGIGWLLGATAIPFVVGFGAEIGVAAALGLSAYGLARYVDPVGTANAVQKVGEIFQQQRGILSDPAFVTIARLAVMSADDAAFGLLQLPAPISRGLGDEGLGICGVDTSAGAAVAFGGVFGLLRETPVTTKVVRTETTTAVSGFADRAARVPTRDGQIRVDRMHREGEEDSFEVYIGGTIAFSLEAGAEPFDMTSNLVGVAGGDSASYRAVQQSLEAAGAVSGSSIAVTGYSQGGLVAAQLASSGHYRVRGLLTLGAPVGQVSVPASVPWVALEHTDDLVPATGGTWRSNDPVVIRRRALDPSPARDNLMFPAHQLSHYRETAALADAAEAASEPRLAGALAGLDGAVTGVGAGTDTGTGTGTGAGTVVESTLYHSERVEDLVPGVTGDGRPVR